MEIEKEVKEVVEEIVTKSLEQIKPTIQYPPRKSCVKFSTIAITCLAVIKFKGLLKSNSPPPSPRFPPNGLIKRARIGAEVEDELYLKGNDISDEIIINVPEKYVNEYEITLRNELNLLTNFLYQIKNIRSKNFSLREITLNRLMILHIEKKDRERQFHEIDLFLNLGLNPYIDFNDYYIEEFNCVNIKSPILVFKRYVRFNPYKIKDLYIKMPMTLKIRFEDITHKGQNIMKDYCTSSTRLHPKAKITISNFVLEYIMNETDIWTVEKEQLYFDLTNKYQVRICVNDFMEIEQMSNLNIWRYGKNILNPSLYKVIDEVNKQNFFQWFRKIEFQWFREIESKEYDLVKNYEKITDFEKIMVEFDDNEDKDEYYKIFENIGYHDIRNKLIDKMKMLSGTSICKEEIISKIDGKNKKKSRLTEILLSYIADVQEYIFYGDDTKIRRYIRKEWLFDTIYDNEKIYQELLNENIFKILEKGLEEYEEGVINNEQMELQTPDIYILLGFHEFPSKFTRELWEAYEITMGYKWNFIIKSQSFLKSTGWYYMYGLCCFFAQLIGPSYYLYNYYLIDENEYCPNNSLTLNKSFAVAYYLVLYARMNSFWSSLTTTVWQYGNTTLITSDNYLRLTLVVNSICLCIIPLFTYTLFIEMSSITDLILNCLTGEFLINIDNLIVEFIGEEQYIKSITKDLLILSFIEKGFPKKNIMEGDTRELWIMLLLQVIQMFGTLLMTGFVYKCI